MAGLEEEAQIVHAVGGRGGGEQRGVAHLMVTMGMMGWVRDGDMMMMMVMGMMGMMGRRESEGEREEVRRGEKVRRAYRICSKVRM